MKSNASVFLEKEEERRRNKDRYIYICKNLTCIMYIIRPINIVELVERENSPKKQNYCYKEQTHTHTNKQHSLDQQTYM